MTEMRRTTICLPADLDKFVLELKKTKRFERSSYADVVRYLIGLGIDQAESEVN